MDDLTVGQAQPGGGKYGREVNDLIERLDADLVALIVVGGVRGPGFSVASRQPPLFVADTLERMAAAIRAGAATLGH